MQTHFPPVPANEERRSEIAFVLTSYESIYVQPEATYVSTPMSSGKRLLDWLQAKNFRIDDYLNDSIRNNSRNERLKRIYRPNCQHALEYGVKLRDYHRPYLIQPAAMSPITTWEQDDYLAYWGEVIRRFCSDAVFVADWQYSNGCVLEFYTAVKHCKRMFCEIPPFAETPDDYHLAYPTPLDPHDGIMLVEQAVADIASRGVGEPTFMEDVLRALRLEVRERGIRV